MSGMSTNATGDRLCVTWLYGKNNRYPPAHSSLSWHHQIRILHPRLRTGGFFMSNWPSLENLQPSSIICCSGRVIFSVRRIAWYTNQSACSHNGSSINLVIPGNISSETVRLPLESYVVEDLYGLAEADASIDAGHQVVSYKQTNAIFALFRRHVEMRVYISPKRWRLRMICSAFSNSKRPDSRLLISYMGFF